MPKKSGLIVNNIRKVYPGVVALDNVSFELRPGEIHALVGENGAGKSTLIKSISGAIHFDSGSLVVDGTEYTQMNPILSRKLGIEVIYQEFNLMPSLTVAENIYLMEAHKKGELVDHKMFMGPSLASLLTACSPVACATPPCSAWHPPLHCGAVLKGHLLNEESDTVTSPPTPSSLLGEGGSCAHPDPRTCDRSPSCGQGMWWV